MLFLIDSIMPNGIHSSMVFSPLLLIERCHLNLTSTSPLLGSELFTICISWKNIQPLCSKCYSYLFQIVMYWSGFFYLALKVLITKKTGRSITTWRVTNCFCFNLQPAIPGAAHSKVHLTISDIVFKLESQKSRLQME